MYRTSEDYLPTPVPRDDFFASPPVAAVAFASERFRGGADAVDASVDGSTFMASAGTTASAEATIRLLVRYLKRALAVARVPAAHSWQERRAPAFPHPVVRLKPSTYTEETTKGGRTVSYQACVRTTPETKDRFDGLLLAQVPRVAEAEVPVTLGGPGA